MPLTDASVVIEYSKRKDLKLLALADSVPVTVCGTTRAEVLAGARAPDERTEILDLLDSFLQLPTPESAYEAVGDNLAKLRSVGLKLPFPDVLVATLGILNDIEVWARDNHFPLMAAHLPGLRLFREPP